MLCDEDYHMDKIVENRDEIENNGIIIEDLTFYTGQNSRTFKGFKSKDTDIFLKIVDSKDINFNAMKKIIKRFSSFFPDIFYTPIIENNIYIFMEEVNVFEGPNDIKLSQLRKILKIIQAFSKKKFYYTDIFYDNFGYKNGRTLLVDFTDLFLVNPNKLRVHGGYEPPKNNVVNSSTLSYLFALFAIEVLFENGYKITNRIKNITHQFAEDVPITPHGCVNKADKFVFSVVKYLLSRDEKSTKTAKMGRRERNRLINQLSEMVQINPSSRKNILNIKL